MHNLYIMCFSALRFVTSKVSGDAFSLIYFNFITCKFESLYLVPLLLNRIGKLLAYVASLPVTSVCGLLSLRG